MFGISQSNCHPIALCDILILQQCTQLRRVVHQLLQVDFDGLFNVSAGHGDIHGAWDVGEARKRRMAVDAIGVTILQGCHLGCWFDVAV